MSSSTQPAFVHYGNWDAHTRSHPAMKWMEEYTKDFESKASWDRPRTEWQMGSPYTYIKSDGTVFSGNEAWEANKASYAAFTKFLHEPCFAVCVDTEYGWEMIGQAIVYANLPGQRAEGEQERVRDQGKGEEWDVKVPAAYRFQYRKDPEGVHGGIRLQKTEVMSESLPIVMMLAKRGVIKLG
jgi:hypothetical protein